MSPPPPHADAIGASSAPDTALRERTLVLLLGMLAAFGPLAIDMYLPAFPAIGRDLGARPQLVGLTLAAYFAGLAVGQLVIGHVADRVGRVKPVRIGLLLFVLGSLAAAMAPAIEVLIAARVLQALGGAAGAVASRAVVRDLYRGAAAARLNSRLVLVMGVAPIVAPMLGGALLELAGWRAIFAALAAAAAVALAVVWTWLPETAPPRGSAPRPTLRGLVGDRDFVRYALVLALSQAALFAYITGAPFVYIELEGATPSEFAWFFSANAAGYIAMSQINVRLLRRHDPARLLVIGACAGLTAAAAFLVLAVTGAGGVWAVAASLFSVLASFGLVMPNGTALALEGQGSQAGVAAAWLGTIGFSMAAAASAAVGALHDGTARPIGGVLFGAVAAAVAVLALAPRPRPSAGSSARDRSPRRASSHRPG